MTQRRKFRRLKLVMRQVACQGEAIEGVERVSYAKLNS
jgi:hypothetical protein